MDAAEGTRINLVPWLRRHVDLTTEGGQDHELL